MFEDQSFSIPADRIDCRVRGTFQLADEVEAARAASWQALRARNAGVFDGALMRMESHDISGGRLSILGSRTSYSAYVTTRHAGFHDEHPDAARADPLGMTAVVLTADAQVIVTRRSLAAEQNPGGLYLIDGYAEPVQGSDRLDLTLEIAREIEEEIAVTDLDRAGSFAIGLAYDPVFCHPELFFFTVSKSEAQVILDGARYAPDRNEAAQLLACPLRNVLAEDGPVRDAPMTWSFSKAKKFLVRHLRETGKG
jgi:hypothetical protein